jgi:hypothetical protein
MYLKTFIRLNFIFTQEALLHLIHLEVELSELGELGVVVLVSCPQRQTLKSEAA